MSEANDCERRRALDAETADPAEALTSSTLLLITRCDDTARSSATGFLLRHDDGLKIVTNSHALELVTGLRDGGHNAWIEASAGDDRRAVQFHGGWLMMPNNGKSLGHENAYQYLDFAVLAVEPAQEAYLLDAKRPFTQENIDGTALAEGEEVLTLGFRSKDLKVDPLARKPYVDAVATPSQTHVLRVTDRLVTLRSFMEQNVGEAEMRGISGSPVIDHRGHLRAILWGGCDRRNELYCCPIIELLHVLQQKGDR